MTKIPSINELKQARKFFKNLFNKARAKFGPEEKFNNFNSYKQAVINMQIARLEDLRNEGRLFVEKYVKVRKREYVTYIKTLFKVQPEVKEEEKNEV